MGMMVFDADILPGRMEVNLINLIGGVYDGILVSDILGGEIELEADFLHESGCRECEYEFEADFTGLFKAGAELLPHLLGQEYPELFGNSHTGVEGAVTIESTGEVRICGDYMSGTDYVQAVISIDRDRLSALMAEHEINELWDGYGRSGFIRTADTDYWVICQAVTELMDSMRGSSLEDLWLIEPVRELARDYFHEVADQELAEKTKCPVHSENGIPWAWGC